MKSEMMKKNTKNDDKEYEKGRKKKKMAMSKTGAAKKEIGSWMKSGKKG